MPTSPPSPGPESASEDPFDGLLEELLDPERAADAPREEAAEDRIARARRIAAANDRLRRDGEIADGTGKPGGRGRRAAPWIAIGAVAAVAIVLVALLAR